MQIGGRMRTHRYCFRCHTEVRKETQIKQYPFYCPKCDENLFRIETYTKKFLKNLAKFEEVKKKYC